MSENSSRKAVNKRLLRLEFTEKSLTPEQRNKELKKNCELEIRI